jgi:hypothetical protein
LAVFLFLALSTPQSCNDGASGNVLSVHEDADYDGDKFEASEDIQKELPRDERFMFEEKFEATRKDDKENGVNPFPKIAIEEAEKKAKLSPLNTTPLLRVPGEKFNSVNGKKILKKFPRKSKGGKRARARGKGLVGKAKGIAGKAKGVAGNGNLDLVKGRPIIKAGKIQFVELNQKMREQCLKNYFFCSVSCADDFKMTCSPDAQIFSTFVTKDQHANICVKPRVHALNRKVLPLKKRVEERKQCILRPCSCKTYEAQFIQLYGKDEFDRALKILQGMCFKWCTTGVKPAGVIDKNQATEAIDAVRKALLEMYRKLYAFIGKFIDFGRKAFEHTKKAVLYAGKKIGEGAKKAGQAIATGGRVVGRAFGGAARKAGRFFGGAARRAGRFFRRFRRW